LATLLSGFLGAVTEQILTSQTAIGSFAI